MLYLILVLLSVSCNKGSTISNSLKAPDLDVNLIMAIKNGETESARDMIEEIGVNIRAVDNNGRTALILATMEGNIDIVNSLINAESNINFADPWGTTALIEAAKNGFLEIAEALLNKGVDIDALDIENENALILASDKGFLKIVEALLNKGAYVNASGQYQSALISAADHGSIEIATALLKAGADVNGVDYIGRNALMLINWGNKCNDSRIEIINILLQYGSGIDDKINLNNKQRTNADTILNQMKNYKQFYKTYKPSLAVEAVIMMIRDHNYNLEIPGHDSEKPILSLGDKTWLLHNNLNIEDKKFILSLDGDLGIPKDE